MDTQTIAPVITSVEDIQGNPVAQDGSTRDTRLTLKGTGEPATILQILDRTVPLPPPVSVTAGGAWTYPVNGLVPGEHVFTAATLDGSLHSNSWRLTVITGNAGAFGYSTWNDFPLGPLPLGRPVSGADGLTFTVTGYAAKVVAGRTDSSEKTMEVPGNSTVRFDFGGDIGELLLGYEAMAQGKHEFVFFDSNDSETGRHELTLSYPGMRHAIIPMQRPSAYTVFMTSTSQDNPRLYIMAWRHPPLEGPVIGAENWNVFSVGHRFPAGTPINLTDGMKMTVTTTEVHIGWWEERKVLDAGSYGTITLDFATPIRGFSITHAEADPGILDIKFYDDRDVEIQSHAAVSFRRLTTEHIPLKAAAASCKLTIKSNPSSLFIGDIVVR
jgi:hypothetical protein